MSESRTPREAGADDARGLGHWWADLSPRDLRSVEQLATAPIPDRAIVALDLARSRVPPEVQPVYDRWRQWWSQHATSRLARLMSLCGQPGRADTFRSTLTRDPAPDVRAPLRYAEKSTQDMGAEVWLRSLTTSEDPSYPSEDFGWSLLWMLDPKRWLSDVRGLVRTSLGSKPADAAKYLPDAFRGATRVLTASYAHDAAGVAAEYLAGWLRQISNTNDKKGLSVAFGGAAELVATAARLTCAASPLEDIGPFEDDPTLWLFQRGYLLRIRLAYGRPDCLPRHADDLVRFLWASEHHRASGTNSPEAVRHPLLQLSDLDAAPDLLTEAQAAVNAWAALQHTDPYSRIVVLRRALRFVRAAIVGAASHRPREAQLYALLLQLRRSALQALAQRPDLAQRRSILSILTQLERDVLEPNDIAEAPLVSVLMPVALGYAPQRARHAVRSLVRPLQAISNPNVQRDTVAMVRAQIVQRHGRAVAETWMHALGVMATQPRLARFATSRPLRVMLAAESTVWFPEDCRHLVVQGVVRHQSFPGEPLGLMSGPGARPRLEAQLVDGGQTRSLGAELEDDGHFEVRLEEGDLVDGAVLRVTVTQAAERVRAEATLRVTASLVDTRMVAEGARPTGELAGLLAVAVAPRKHVRFKRQLSAGMSSAQVWQIDADEPYYAPLVVKMGPPGALEEEFEAYQNTIAATVPALSFGVLPAVTSVAAGALVYNLVDDATPLRRLIDRDDPDRQGEARDTLARLLEQMHTRWWRNARTHDVRLDALHAHQLIPRAQTSAAALRWCAPGGELSSAEQFDAFVDPASTAPAWITVQVASVSGRSVRVGGPRDDQALRIVIDDWQHVVARYPELRRPHLVGLRWQREPLVENRRRTVLEEAEAQFYDDWVTNEHGWPVSPVHGDLHPDNIMVRGGQPYLIDFADASLRGCPYLDLAKLEIYVRLWGHRGGEPIDAVEARLDSGTPDAGRPLESVLHTIRCCAHELEAASEKVARPVGCYDAVLAVVGMTTGRFRDDQPGRSWDWVEAATRRAIARLGDHR